MIGKRISIHSTRRIMYNNIMKKFLFTTLPSNDLGLLTRSLPIAQELTKLGHKIVFSSPAKAPDSLIKNAEIYSHKLKTYGGPKKAAEIIENFANKMID